MTDDMLLKLVTIMLMIHASLLLKRNLLTDPLIYLRLLCSVCKVVKIAELYNSAILGRQNELTCLQTRFHSDSVENVSSWQSQNLESGKMSGIASLGMTKIF
jgi:hypothetical protein